MKLPDWLLNCFWPSPVQWSLVPSPTRLMTIFYSLTSLGAFRPHHEICLLSVCLLITCPTPESRTAEENTASLCIPLIGARQRLSKHVPTATNYASFSMRLVSYRECNFRSYFLESCLRVVSNLIHISFPLLPNSQFAEYFSCYVSSAEVTLSSDLGNVTRAASVLIRSFNSKT
jgi:hypothetical protein